MASFIIRGTHSTGATKTLETSAYNAKDALTSFYITTSKQGLDFNTWLSIDIDLMGADDDLPATNG